jgi:hypothetical protein
LSSGLYYPEDANDELLNDIFNKDYQEKHYSSIPNDKDVETWRYRVKGGPQLSKHATSAEKTLHSKKRKAFTDNTRRKLYSKHSKIASKLSPSKDVGDEEIYSGNQSKGIRLMAVVETCPLMAGHTFREKETLMLRIAEEANLRNIRVKVQRSCTMKYEVAGPQFFVSASLSPSGWIVRHKICREDDDIMSIPLRGIAFQEKSLRSPFTGIWLGKILLPHLELCPGMNEESSC